MNDLEQIADLMVGASRFCIKHKGRMKRLPVLGGELGAKGIVLHSIIVDSPNIHNVAYFAVHGPSGSAIGQSNSKAGALAKAREFIDHCRPIHFELIANMVRQKLAEIAEKEREADKAEREEYRQSLLAKHALLEPKVKPISKRRKMIFDKSEGKCHYCLIALDLRGLWHVEHMMPKSLGGSNEPINLVASCAPCNRKKHNRTDLEFIAMRNKGAA